MKLPGIEPYTAGAVACFAYERDVSFLDTNMRRVLHRYFFGLRATTTVADKQLLSMAKELVPPRRSWRWNQALMETGVLICTARSPFCDECPLREGCSARAEATSAGWPKPERKTPAHRYEGSNRYYRGKVLAELRKVFHASGEGIALRELGPRVKQDFDERAPRWLLAAVESLCSDGLAKIELGHEAADVPGMVAKERATYGAGAQQSDSFSLDQVVSLP